MAGGARMSSTGAAAEMAAGTATAKSATDWGAILGGGVAVLTFVGGAFAASHYAAEASAMTAALKEQVGKLEASQKEQVGKLDASQKEQVGKLEASQKELAKVLDEKLDGKAKELDGKAEKAIRDAKEVINATLAAGTKAVEAQADSVKSQADSVKTQMWLPVVVSVVALCMASFNLKK